MKKNLLMLITLFGALTVFAACGSSEQAKEPTKALVAKPTSTPTQMQQGNIVAFTPTPMSLSPSTSSARTLEIGVDGDLLEFDQTTMTAKAGESLIVTLKNSSSVNQHNWVLVQDGTKDDIATLGLDRADYGYVPQDIRVVISTKLVNAGQTGEITFNAPAAGTYQFVCTFPGHSFTMFGTFEVES